MLSSDNYKKRLLLGAVDDVHYFLIGKMTILLYVFVENLTKSTNDRGWGGGGLEYKKGGSARRLA